MGFIHPPSPPCRRDGKGCSNGCYVLGYRIYVNGRCWLSVDGALTAKAALSSPIQSPSSILVQVRSVSAAWSEIVICWLLQDHNTLVDIEGVRIPPKDLCRLARIARLIG